MALDYKSRPAKSGKARSLVIFLHGYGADGADLLGIGDSLAAHLPDTMFAAPDAPEPCRGNPTGFQWFPVPMFDGSSAAQMLRSLENSTAELQRFLDKLAVDSGIPPGKTCLFGFSQGTMMSLHIGPQQKVALAGIVGFSGRLLQAELLKTAKSKPPILLIHGDADPVVPYESLGIAANALKANGFDVISHTSRGVAHGIAPDGLGLALGFIQRQLTETKPQ